MRKRILLAATVLVLLSSPAALAHEGGQLAPDQACNPATEDARAEAPPEAQSSIPHRGVQNECHLHPG